MLPELLDAARFGRTEEVEALLRLDLDVNWQDDYGFTALHLAARWDHLQVVKLLLQHSTTDVNAKGKGGFTPFSQSCFRGTVSVVCELLRDPLVDIILAEDYECTPLWWASSQGHYKVIELLIASGRDLGDLGKKRISGSDGVSLAERTSLLIFEGLFIFLLVSIDLQFVFC